MTTVFLRLCAALWLFLFASCSHKMESDEELPTLPTKSHDTNLARQSHILYQIQTGKREMAIDKLLEARKEDPYIFHSAVLETLGLGILEEGMKASTREELMHCLIGVNISLDERMLPVVQKAFSFEDPDLSLAALHVLASLNTDKSHEVIEEAMRSDFVIVRLEAAYLLAKMGTPHAFSQIDTLMLKVPKEARPLFPELFAIEASDASMQTLRRLLFDADEAVRAQAVLAIAQSCRDELLPDIRKLAKEPSTCQQEACAYALGVLQDHGSIELLHHIVANGTPAAMLAANYSLVTLGDIEAQKVIQSEVLHANPFAIRLLGQLSYADELLISCLESDDLNIRVNAALALLEKRDSRALPVVTEICLSPQNDIAFGQIFSYGGALRAWKAIPSASAKFSENRYAEELSLRLREQVLVQALELSEESFLSLARQIFLHQQKDLIPTCVRLLENIRSKEAIALLKDEEKHLGSPFIRSWCSLALFRLNEEGASPEAVRTIVKRYQELKLFQTRPIVPWGARGEETSYSLTLEESAQLLVEAYSALAERQDEEGVKILLEALRDGNSQNRYTLAGLLLRASV